MKKNISEKLLMAAVSIIGIITSTIEWPIYLVVAGVRAVRTGDARKYFVCTLQYVGYGALARTMYISALVMAAFNKEKSDELFNEAKESHRKFYAYLEVVYG